MMLGREDVIMRAEWWFRAQALEPSLQSHIRCVTLGKLLALSVPQFPHQYHEAGNNSLFFPIARHWHVLNE